MSPGPFMSLFPKRRNFMGLAAAIAIVFLVSPGNATAMTAPGSVSSNPATLGPVPFADFVASLKQPGALAGSRRTVVPPDGDDIRQYLLGMYDGVDVPHSFERGGQIFDCLAIADQPSVRLGRQTAIAEPPPFSPPGPAAADADRDARPIDAYGNLQACAQGSVPIRRITPDEIARFGSLRRFFAKDPSAAGTDMQHGNAVSPATSAPPDVEGRWVGTESEPGAPAPHLNITLNLGENLASGAVGGMSTQADSGRTQYYAYDQLGGSIEGKVLTLTQQDFFLQNVAAGTHWCLGTATLTYSASGAAPTLTGKLIAPGCKPATVRLTEVPVVHHYATRTQAVANLGGSSSISLWKPALNPSGVQIFSLAQQWYSVETATNRQTAEVGWQEFPEKYRTFNPVFFIYWTADNYTKTGCYNMDCPGYVQTDKAISPGGMYTQYGRDGKAVDTVTVGFYLYKDAWWLSYGSSWIGYYPASLYGAGGMSKGAERIQFGGETVGAGSWPAMGNGAFASQPNAAFQEGISYWTRAGILRSAPLTEGDAFTPNCYTVGPNLHGKGAQGSYFLFGGPGGIHC
jgi:hypothetical protein